MPNEKLKEALHHVIAHCDDPSRLGATRLNKIMWYADTYAFRKNGVSITGDGYVKRKYGPVPKHVLASLRSLEGEGKIVARDTPWVREFFARQAPHYQELSEEDRHILSAFTKVICDNFSAKEISEETHDDVWEAAQDGEEIPLFAVFAARCGTITDEVRAWANETVKVLAA